MSALLAPATPATVKPQMSTQFRASVQTLNVDETTHFETNLSRTQEKNITYVPTNNQTISQINRQQNTVKNR